MVSLQDLNNGMTGCGNFEIVCPICHGELALENPYRRFGRVRTGKLRCLDDCATYPIVYGVPVMLLPGRPAAPGYYMPNWKWYLKRHGKQNLVEAIDKGNLIKEPEITGSPIPEGSLKKAKRWMTRVGWERYVKSCKTSSEELDAVAIGDRISRTDDGVVMDIACGGGFTTERALREIKPSVYSISTDISFECVKLAGKRAELLGMRDRSMEICTDARYLPFADGSIAAACTRAGFNHIRGYVDALRDIHRILEVGGRLVAAEGKLSMWLEKPGEVGISLKEQYEILRRLDLFVSKDEFIESLRQVRFSVLSVEDLPEPKSHEFIVEAVKSPD